MSEKDVEKQTPRERIPITGRFDQYRSSYWAAAVAAVSERYFVRPFVRHWWDDEKYRRNEISYNKRHAYAGFTGGIMAAITGFYAFATYRDMKSIFVEAVAAEFDKKPEDVTIRDLWASKNSAVEHTRANYIKYNARRFGVSSLFLLPFIAPKIPFLKKLFTGDGPNHKGFLVHPESGTDIGIGISGAYLLSDVINRKATFFETLQMVIDREVNHTDRPDERITASDLLTLYEANIKDRTPELSFASQRGTPAWEKTMGMFGRMAELMNATYNNDVAKEKCALGFPQFIFLIGHGLIDPAHVERSCAYIELANQHGLKAVKQVAAAVKRNVPFEKAAAAYPIRPHGGECGIEQECDAPTRTHAGKIGVPLENLAAREELRNTQADTRAL